MLGTVTNEYLMPLSLSAKRTLSVNVEDSYPNRTTGILEAMMNHCRDLVHNQVRIEDILLPRSGKARLLERARHDEYHGSLAS